MAAGSNSLVTCFLLPVLNLTYNPDIFFTFSPETPFNWKTYSKFASISNEILSHVFFREYEFTFKIYLNEEERVLIHVQLQQLGGQVLTGSQG